MPGGYSQQLLDEIRARVDIVELVGQVVKLKRAGENWKGLCPFHTEKTPSFTVNPEARHLPLLRLRRGRRRLRLPHAPGSPRLPRGRARAGRPRRRRAARGREPTPEAGGKLRGAAPRDGAGRRRSTADALWEAGRRSAPAPISTQRGVDPEVARRFGLGYAPEGWDTLLGRHAPARASARTLLGRPGSSLPRQNGPGFYDRFRGRLLFPIRDSAGPRRRLRRPRARRARSPSTSTRPETPLYVEGQTALRPRPSPARRCASSSRASSSRATSTA